MKTGTVLADADIERLARLDQYYRGREKAVRLLSIRPRTKHEIKTALDAIGLISRIRNGIIEELVERGLVDDERFARDFITARIEQKKMGPHRLRFDLKKRGLGSALIDKALVEAFADASQDDLAWDIVRRKLGAKKPDERDVRRLSSLLRRRGLDYEVINRVTYELLQRAHVDPEPGD